MADLTAFCGQFANLTALVADLTAFSCQFVDLTELGWQNCQHLLANCWPDAFEVPHASRKSHKIEIWACDFLFLGVCLHHYSYGFCMVKTRQRSRCEGTFKKLLVDLLECPAPVVKLDLGIDWPVSSQSNLTEPGWQTCQHVDEILLTSQSLCGRLDSILLSIC